MELLGCYKNTSIVLGACAHKKDTVRAVGACHKMENTTRVVGASWHNTDVKVAVEVPRHAAALGVTPVIVGLAVGFRVTNIGP